MADLGRVLGGPWSPPAEKRVAPPEEQLRDAMVGAGLTPPEVIHMDGKIHRFKSEAKGTDKNGWYVIFGDGIPAGRFGCWKQGLETNWRADVGRKLSTIEEMAHARRMAEAKAIREAELERQHEVASQTVEMIWSSAQAASPDHPYLKRKGVGVHGARVTGDGRLVVPLFDVDGSLSTLQYISADGSKLYHPGGQTGGKFWSVGHSDEAGPVFLAEGFATAATVHEATGRPCFVAYSASNLVGVTGSLRELYGAGQEIIIVADNDKSGVGAKYAEQSSAKHGAKVVIPPIEGMDANDYAQAGHDLLLLLFPPKSEWLIAADDFSAKPAPISWLVKNWLQDDALIMVHGPSGGGKTFVMLDWVLGMAAGRTDWFDNKVKPGPIVYLAGEGHHGLRGRIAAWKHHNGVSSLNMWLSKDGCDLNTAQGYAKVVEQIRSLPVRPKAIVVDTLHRFLHGDENSAQDAKTMLDACNNLMREFGCTVILVHHTGVSEETQHRARGSSAWRGALDIEISILPGKPGDPIQIVQRKSKDAELAKPVYVELQSVEIPGWIDEDGNPVTSAVIVGAEKKTKEKSSGKLDTHRRTFENAWWHAGAEDIGGKPYLSRAAMQEYLISNMGVNPESAKIYIKPSSKGRVIFELLNAEIITASENGWIVVDDTQVTAMMLRRGA